MILALYIVFFAFVMLSLWLLKRGDRYQMSAKELARQLVSERAQWAKITAQAEIKPLTPRPAKAQDVRKPLSGAQLRRMAEQVNAADVASLQERPNSEILQEKENG
jgi:hypothetical protein